MTHARRGRILDWYVGADESAVFVDGNVVVLSALATRVVQLVETGWTDVDDVVIGVLEAFGPPPGDASPRAATVAVLESLERQGIVNMARSGYAPGDLMA